jgi:hypothetical protein
MDNAPKAHTALQSLQSTLEVGTKLLALIAALCLALSVIYDWGYLAALDLTFSEVPTSLSDHARSAILWLPLSASLLPLAIVVNLFFDQLDAKEMREVEIKGQDVSTHIKNEAKRARGDLACIALVSMLLWLAFGYRARFFLSCAVICFWVLIVVRATPHDQLGTRASMLLRFGLVVIPLFPFGLYVAGYNTARQYIAPHQQFGKITVRHLERPHQLSANVVRFFERSVVAIDDNNKVILLKPNDIVYVEKNKSISINNGLICDYWHALCPREP